MAARKIGLVSMVMLTALLGLLWSYALVSTRTSGTVEVQTLDDPSWRVQVQDVAPAELATPTQE